MFMVKCNVGQICEGLEARVEGDADEGRRTLKINVFCVVQESAL